MLTIQEIDFAATRDELLRLQAEFEQQRAAWDQERLQESNRLSEEAQWLAEAWKALETEQRRIAGQREALQAAGGGSIAAKSPDLDGQSAGARSGADFPPGGEDSGPEWTHLRQLRREIQRHARSTGSQLGRD